MNGYERRKMEKRNEILAATKDLVSRIPLSEISIHSIAVQAKISHVTIYNLFEKKSLLINEAVKALTIEDISEIYEVISSDLPIFQRLEKYFSISFQHSVRRPEMKSILQYIFSGNDPDLMGYVQIQYERTMPHLVRLYQDGLKGHLIRESISLDHFLNMLDIYTRIDRPFLVDENLRRVIIECIIRSFS